MNTISIPVQDPVSAKKNILGGTPVIKGTRIPATLVLDLLTRGYSLDLIVKEYPSLTKKKLSDFLKLISKSFNVSQAKTLQTSS